jgi:metallo-beta-lactamase family protein
VFLTHAHIDHCGGLPVLENRGLLDDDAPIITTPPTAQIAHTLLEDSLKIHKHETRSSGKTQQFTQEDVKAVYDRFTPIGYGEYKLRDIANNEDETLTFELGNAAHLLGSAWIAMQVDGYSTVFSGDLGGRAGHLNDIEKLTILLQSQRTEIGIHTEVILMPKQSYSTTSVTQLKTDILF